MPWLTNENPETTAEVPVRFFPGSVGSLSTVDAVDGGQEGGRGGLPRSTAG